MSPHYGSLYNCQPIESLNLRWTITVCAMPNTKYDRELGLTFPLYLYLYFLVMTIVFISKLLFYLHLYLLKKCFIFYPVKKPVFYGIRPNTIRQMQYTFTLITLLYCINFAYFII